MAPAKLNIKKKRVAGGVSASSAAAGSATAQAGSSSVSSNGSATVGGASGMSETFVSSTPMSLDQSGQYYGHLLHDSKRLRFRLELQLWIHEIVALVVLNALMYEETVEVPQLVAVILASLWLGRLFLLKHTTKSRASDVWKRFAVSRGLLLLAFACVFIAVHTHCIGKLTKDRVTTLGVVATLDVVSVVNSVYSTHAHAALKTTHAIEVVFITGIFSTQYNHQPYLIYDRYAFFLTLGVCLAHFFIVDSIHNAMFTAMWTSEDDVSRNQQQRWDAVEEVHKLLDHGMSLKPVTARGKNKELKSFADEENDARIQAAVRTNRDSRSDLSWCLGAQAVVVVLQLVATTFFLYSWELCSLTMCSSILLLFEVTRLRWSLERSCPLPSSVDELLAGSTTPARKS